MEKYNLIVAGGGLTGVAATISAAREGLRVLLIEKSGCLGGAMSNNLVYPFMRFWTDDPENGNRKYLSSGIFKEMLEKSQKYGSSPSEMYFKPEYFKFTLDEMITEENVDVLFHSTIFNTETDSTNLKNVSIATKSGVLTIDADFFIDATGDGDLFALAGCDYQLGRETDGLCQPMTTCFRMCGIDVKLFLKERDSLQNLYNEYRNDGKIKNPREDILAFTGIADDVIHFNTTRIVKLNPTDAFDISRAEIEARRQIYEIITFLKENSKAFKNSTLISIASEIGVRESRKLKGMHILTEDEIKNLTDFEDSIALGNYDIDIHNPSGTGTSHYYFKPGEYYKIPYRSLLPKEYSNLLVAGRCISATHAAQASIRIMPICACLGEAAGTAAAVAYNSGKTAHTVDVKAVQQKLTENGAAI